MSLTNVIISENNTYGDGGGIHIENSNPFFTNVTINGNTTSGDGGGIYSHDSSNPSLKNVNITGNSAVWGGGISCSFNSSLCLTNVTITENTASENGGGIYCRGSNPSLLNCILWNDTPQEIYFSQSGSPNTITISYSDVMGDSAGIVTNNNCTVNWLEGNIDSDPLFINPDSLDYHFLSGSPCIDSDIPDTTGLNLPTFDLDGNPRIYNGIVDMGAYEWQGYGVDEWEHPHNSSILYQNYPNPFSTSTTISFGLKEKSPVKLSVYNIKGELVEVLINEEMDAGNNHQIIWNGTSSNKNFANGIYFYKFEAGDKTFIKKMVLMQ